MNPMKYRKATWTTVPFVKEDQTAAALEVQRLQELSRKEGKIYAFMNDLKLLTERHGVTLSHNFGDGDVCLFEGNKCLSDSVDFDTLEASVYVPPIPRVRPEGYTTNLDIVGMGKYLEKTYMESIRKQLNEPSIFEDLLTKLRES